ncbi:MAG: ribonuclease HI [Cryomorphaceae bacterium]
MDIAIYTDGSSRGNPGPGGYGVVLISKQGHYKELSQGFRKTTNNRMELLSVIVALESLKKPGNEVCVFSDSKYVVDAVEKGWLKNWERKGFAKTKNPDLWQRYLRIAPTQKVSFEWVKGHAGNKYNERCDLLAVKAATGKDLKIDKGYEMQHPTV